MSNSFVIDVHKIPKWLHRYSKAYGALSVLPFRFLKNIVDEPESVSHSKWVKHLSGEFNKKGLRVLEIGSRVVTGANLSKHFDRAEYVGFDIYEGENVDVVGDAHKLASYFEGEEFDLIFSSAVFEHLYMPWLVAEQIAKLLKVGGFLFVETHFSFNAHERPWNFFQFSDMGLRALFNPGLGFETIESGMSNPIGGYYTARADPQLRYKPIHGLYCHSEIFCKKTKNVASFQWEDLEASQVVGNTLYPAPKV